MTEYIESLTVTTLRRAEQNLLVRSEAPTDRGASFHRETWRRARQQIVDRLVADGLMVLREREDYYHVWKITPTGRECLAEHEYGAEYVLNMDTYNNDLNATGVLYRVDGGRDVVTKVGPLDFGGER